MKAELDQSEAVDWVEGDIESVSYDRLAERIRSLVATYRASRARETEREVVDRLQDRIQQTERKITALHSIAMELNATSSASAVYEQTVRAAEEILDLDICFAFAAEDDQFVPQAQSSTPTERELRPVPLDAGVMGETYRTGESDRTVDMSLHQLAEPDFGDYQSGISVPIGEFGVFQAVSKQAGAFDEIDLELTELLAAHAASVLQRLTFEDQLRVERDQFAALFKNSTDCIIEAEFVDDEAIIRRVNPAFESVFGYSQESVNGKAVDEVIVGAERRDEAEALTQQVHEGEFVKAEVRRQTSEGLKDFLLRSVPVEEDRLYAVYTDITEQKETERTIEQQKRALDNVASSLSHDLRNPLNVAQGRLEIVRDDLSHDHLDAVAEAQDRMETLIDDVLSLAKAGESVGEAETVELDELVETCWRNIETNEASIVSESELAIKADESRLKQLFENLIGNSIMHGGGDVTITVGELVAGFYLEDDGPGIPEAEREKVFKPGYSSHKDGTGFGLSIVREIAEAHDWEIIVTTSSEGGARFEFTGI